MPEIVRRERRWVGRRNKWVSFPYTIRRIGRWWKVSVQLDSGNVVRLGGRFGSLQDAMDAADEHEKTGKKDEPDLEDASADAAVQEHVDEDTSPIEVDASELDDDPGLVASPDPTVEAEGATAEVAEGVIHEVTAVDESAES